MKTNLLLITGSLILMGCQDKISKSESMPTTTISPGTPAEVCDYEVQFAGIKTVTDITDSTAQINWDADPNAVGYVLFKKNNKDELKAVRKFGAKKNQFKFKKLKPDRQYTYLLRTISKEGSLDCNENFKEFKTEVKNTFKSCLEIHTHYNGTKPSGEYEIDTDLTGPKAPISVFCDMQNNNGGWTRVFKHQTTAGYFANDAEAKEANITDPGNAKYSILGKLAEFKREGKFQFWIHYPEVDGTDGGNIWTQTSNPVTDPVSDYVAIRETYNGMYWGGLEKHNNSRTLIDGSVNKNWWFYAIGAKRSWPRAGVIPGPIRNQGMNEVQLFIK